MQVKNVVDNYQRFNKRKGAICTIYEYSILSCSRIKCHECQKCKIVLKDDFISVVKEGLNGESNDSKGCSAVFSW